MAVGKGFSYFFITEFFADCLDELVVKSVLIFFRTKILCRLSLLAGGKGFFADCLYWLVVKDLAVGKAQFFCSGGEGRDWTRKSTRGGVRLGEEVGTGKSAEACAVRA